VSDDDAWFVPKLYGFGPGIPISWQGWALTFGYVAICVADGLLLAREKPLAFVAVLVPFTVVFLVAACAKTRGGCQWRWKGEE